MSRARIAALLAASRFLKGGGPPPPDPLKDALLAFWPYTEASGAALDVSGHGKTAVLAGTTPPSRIDDGTNGRVMRFIRTDQGYLDVGAPIVATRPTWAIVVRAAWTERANQIVFYGEGQASGGPRLMLASEGFGQVQIFFTSTADGVNVYNPVDYGNGAYHTIVAQRTGPSTYEIWGDGELGVATTGANVQPTSYTAATIGVVARNGGRDSYFDGKQQMLALFNRALTADEIAELATDPRGRLS